MASRSWTLAAVAAAAWLSVAPAAGALNAGPALRADPVRNLIVQLESTSAATCATASKALGEMGRRALPAVAALKKQMADTRRVRIETPMNGIVMMPVQLQPTTTVGLVAAEALFEIDPSAILEVLRTGPEAARRTAADAASHRIKDPHGLQAALLAAGDRAGVIRFEAIRGLIKSADPRALKQVVAAMGDSAPQIRSLAVDAVGRRKDCARHVDRLLDVMLRDEHHYPRGIAAYHLGQFKDPEVIRALLVALKDPNSFVRAQAADSLSLQPSEETTKALVQALGDSDNQVLRAVLRALLCVRDPGASDAAVRLINHNSPYVREAAVRLVGYYPDRHVDTLLAALRDKRSCSARSAAAESLARTAKPDARIVPAILRQFEKEGVNPYPRVLAALGTPEAVNALKGLLLDEGRPAVQRATVAWALGTVGTADARAALARFTDHPDSHLRSAARRGLQASARRDYPRTPALRKPPSQADRPGGLSKFQLYWTGRQWGTGAGRVARTNGAVAGGLVLSGIVGSGAGGAAIINGKIVRVGDQVCGRKVVAIEGKTVRLDADGREIVLTLK